MPTLRETPYSAFNFLVSIGEDSGKEFQAGFAEVSGLSAEITLAEYRNGNEKTNYLRKIPGINKSGDITLKRGVIGASNLWTWLNELREGKVDSGKRNVTVQLQSEDRSEVVVSWKLTNVFPSKWTGPTLAAKGGGDVAMEELVLAVENIEMDEQ
jgi:phage tail-like protein